MASSLCAIEAALILERPTFGSLKPSQFATAAIAEGLATQAEIDRLVDELYGQARDPGILMSMPRVVQAWAREPI